MGFADNKQKFIFNSEGFVLPADARKLLVKLVRSIGMRPARNHPIDDYPYDCGEGPGGGNGYTLYQPLIESYAIMDVYYDRNETEVLISTCMPERLTVDAVKSFLSREIGPTTGGKLKEE
jgi:hypothetical protein